MTAPRSYPLLGGSFADGPAVGNPYNTPREQTDPHDEQKQRREQRQPARHAGAVRTVGTLVIELGAHHVGLAKLGDGQADRLPSRRAVSHVRSSTVAEVVPDLLDGATALFPGQAQRRTDAPQIAADLLVVAHGISRRTSSTQALNISHERISSFRAAFPSAISS
jgi:hypothetical protein